MDFKSTVIKKKPVVRWRRDHRRAANCPVIQVSWPHLFVVPATHTEVLGGDIWDICSSFLSWRQELRSWGLDFFS